MAMNWQTFRVRSLSAIVFVAVMLTGLLWNEWSFLILFSVIHAGCWIEYQKLIQQIDIRAQQGGAFRVVGSILIGWGIMLYLSSEFSLAFLISLEVAGIYILSIGTLILFVNEVLHIRIFYIKNIFYILLGLLYLSLSFGLLLHIRSGALWMPADKIEGLEIVSVSLAKYEGLVMPLIIIGSIWINDTMAYIVGSLIGKTPLSKVSPKKTWEGTIGGVLLSVGLAWAIGQFLMNQSGSRWAVIACIAAVAGTLGDLLESKLKRMAGVKDSGAILPGHGGFLDRFDSLLLAAPMVWLYLEICS